MSSNTVFLLVTMLLAMAAQCNANFFLIILVTSKHWLRKGETYSFSFHTDILGTTTWDCRLATQDAPLGTSQLFKCDYDFLKKCDFRECKWDVRDDTEYLLDIPQNKYVRWAHT
ncbi:hypothetical protein Pyn_28288 [Prunus yedoensis var. nudiflora]|uniref:Uncharacterized protein n=1 Tax=Prunus yedoensis var. nudiflora TaxID=2094558 RepID=A0A314UJ67_PRUYE|nr:hypothetical protein Pyn_28288 [Prunus yedoensis var. nudiflora]